MVRWCSGLEESTSLKMESTNDTMFYTSHATLTLTEW